MTGSRTRRIPLYRTLVLGASLLLTGAGCGSDPKAPSQVRADGAKVETWPTWVLSAPDEIAVPPPPVPGSVAERSDAAELARLAHDPGPRGAAIVRRWDQASATEPWTNLNVAFVSGTNIDPPRAARAYALTSVAMYDAVVAAGYWKRRYRRPAPDVRGAMLHSAAHAGYPSERAAAAGAASRTLAYLFPHESATRLDRMADEAAGSRVLGGASYPSDVEAGLDLGRAVAGRVIAGARTDGSQETWHARPPRGREQWSPSPGGAANPADPLAGTWRRWVLTSGSQFRPPPPPTFGGARFVSEARELIRLRTALTPEQQRIAHFWAGAVGSPLPPGVWNQIAVAYAGRDKLSTAPAARLFALLNVAMADTATATWDAKFAYWSPRPENAIRDLGLARHWRPFLATPPFPSYVSAHSAFSGAASEVLARQFPSDAPQFREKAEQAGISRLYGGIHYRADHVVGLRLGRKVGVLAIAAAVEDARPRPAR
jgi:hypothetical protein